MKHHLFLLFLLIISIDVYAQKAPVLVDEEVYLDDYLDQVEFFKLKENYSIGEDSLIQINKDEIPSKGEIWIKFAIESTTNAEIILEFYRNDIVVVYDLVNGSESKTGYVVPASQKTMLNWSNIALSVDANTQYPLLIRLENIHHNNDPHILIAKRTFWLENFTTVLAVDFLFLGLVLIMSLYHFFVFLISREKAYLFLSLYLAAILFFFMFATGFLRFFVFKENPALTIYFFNLALASPVFYYYFLLNFLDTKKLIPVWDKVLGYMVYANLGVIAINIFMLLLGVDFMVVSKVIQVMLGINIIVALIAVYLLFQKRNSLTTYFIVGSLTLLIGLSLDVYFWNNVHEIGYFSRIGICIEILLFSLGLGSKMRNSEIEKQLAQESYINQLVVNEGLIKEQKESLEKMVEERTSQLVNVKNEAEAANQAKTDFLSVMSHEIRTPMNAIIGLTHLMNDEFQNEKHKENMNALKFSADNLMLLINDILDYNKIEAGKIELEEMEFDLHKLINHLRSVFTIRTQEKGIGLNFIIDPNTPTIVKGDPARLSQILNNFLSNAIKFTEEGEVTFELFVSLNFQSKAEIEFKISDTGIGIPEERLNSVFDHFTQANIDTSRKFGGTGLGLPIAQKLVRLMGGEVSIISEIDKGSVFSFSVILEKSKNQSLNSEIENIDDVDLTGLRVLVVADNHMNRLVLGKFLKKWGVVASNASSGAEAIKLKNTSKFDLVLLDIQMPEMDGYQVARIIRDTADENQSVPIIAVSADSITNVYDKIIEVGMNDFVTKPFDPQQLQEKIFRFCKITDDSNLI